MGQRERRLQYAGHSGGGLQMADIGLHRAHQQVALTPWTHHARQRLDLSGVAQRRARAMRFHIADVRRIHARGRQRLANGPVLRRAVGDGKAGARAIVAHCRSADHGEDAPAVAYGGRQALQHQHAAAFAASVAIGGGIECLGTAVRRQRAQLGKHDASDRVEDYVDAAGQRQFAFARVERLGGQMERDQRGGARRGHGQHRPLQPQIIGQASGGEAEIVTGQHIRIDTRHVEAVRRPERVVATHHAHVDSGGCAAQAVGGDSGVFERLPTDFEKQALLWVELPGFARRDAEEIGVEAVHRIQKTALAHRHLARRGGVGVVESVRVPAVRGDAHDGIPARFQQAPIIRGRAHASRETAAGADDGDGFRAALLERGHFRAQAADLHQRILQKPVVIGRRDGVGSHTCILGSASSSASSNTSACASLKRAISPASDPSVPGASSVVQGMRCRARARGVE